jgi:hypothetical protein
MKVKSKNKNIIKTFSGLSSVDRDNLNKYVKDKGVLGKFSRIDQSTGNAELDKYIKKKFPEYDIYPADKSSVDIFVGYLRKPEDITWNNPKTYYYNSNFSIKEMASIKDVKI